MRVRRSGFNVRRALVLAAVAVGLGAGVARAQDGAEPEDDTGFRASVAKTAKATVGEPASIPVELKVLDRHYVYAERSGITLVKEIPGVTLAGVDAPTPKTKFDKFENKDVPIYETGAHTFTARLVFDKPGKQTVELLVKSQACTAEYCLFPGKLPVTVTVDVAAKKAAALPSPLPTAAQANGPGGGPGATPLETKGQGEGARPQPTSTATTVAPVEPAPKAETTSIFTDEKRMADLIGSHFLAALGIAFLGGLLISGTPCVYPMIPITISVIGAQAASSRWRGFFLSLVYVGGITLVYSLLGIVAALSHKEFGFLLQSPYVRLGIAFVFLALAASMFGAFSIQLPSGLQTKLMTYNGSGVAGVFVTGLFAGIVAGPCTAPVLLGILVAISSGAVGPMGGFALMASFSLGMGVLFVVIGTFSGALAALPQSGLWMVRVKEFFGALLVAAALYYLGLAVPEWLFALCLGAALVLGGVHVGAATRLEPDAAGAARLGKAVGALAVAAGLYFFVGGLSASGWGPEWLPRGGAVATNGGGAGAKAHGFAWIPDEEAGLRASADQGVPAVIDFYADWCAACKELDEYTFSDARVVAAAGKDFIPIKIDTTERLSTTDEEKARFAELKKKYAVRGLPKVVFVRPDGSVIEELAITGFVKAEVFLERLERAREASRGSGSRAER